MPVVSLTDFVDFASKSGTSRMTAVRTIKQRPEYHPRRDYYRELREFLQEMHQGNVGIDEFSNVLAKLKETSKIKHFEDAFQGHKKFIRRKKLDYFEPPYGKWNHSALSVRVNPELGLFIDGKPHIVKLYFKSESLSKQKTEVIAHVMDVSLRKGAPEGSVMSVLDLRRGKLYAPTITIRGLDVLLASEANAFLQLWEGL